MEKILLNSPIKRGDTMIESIELLPVAVPALHGMKLANVSQLDVDDLITLIPRISVPTLTKPEVEAMPLADILACGTEFLQQLALGEGQEVPEIQGKAAVNTGTLRGLKLTDVLFLDVNTLLTLIPRIDKSMTAEQLRSMPLPVFSNLAQQVAGFFEGTSKTQ